MKKTELLLEILKCLIVILVVALGTFPETSWTYQPGIDSPLSWVYNYLFAHDLSLGKGMVFPHGPYAFFMYPLPENLPAFLLVQTALKALLVLNLYFLAGRYAQEYKWLVIFIVAYLISLTSGFNQLILANLIVLYSNYYFSEHKGKVFFKVLAFIITGFAFYVRLYIAVLACTLCLSFLLLELYANRNIRHFLVDAFSIVGIIYAFWIITYGTLKGFIPYLIGVLNLIMDNSSAASFYPYNNWWLIIISFLAILAIIFANRGAESRYFWWLISITSFSAWKHAMSREDIYHAYPLVLYLLIVLSIFVAFFSRRKFWSSFLAIVAITTFSLNLENTESYFQKSLDLTRFSNFKSFVTNSSALKEASVSRSMANIMPNALPPEVIDPLRNSSFDVYPWDYSIIPANDLKWNPRPIIHSYASYTSYLDKTNSMHFASEAAPDYIIWHLNTGTRGINGGAFNSIDYRYILNDEPNTVLQVLSHYNFHSNYQNKIILKRRDKPVALSTNSLGQEESGWGDWIRVPHSQASILRVKLAFGKGLVRRLKSFFYKDEQFWIYLKLSNGEIHKYRIVPQNAEDGLWINPYLFDYNSNNKIEQISFQGSSQKILTDSIHVEWEEINLADGFVVSAFFGGEESAADTSTHTLTSVVEMNSEYYRRSQLNGRPGAPGSGEFPGEILKPDSFSSVYAFPLDSLADLARISLEGWVESPKYKRTGDILAVISIEKNGTSLSWKAIAVDDQLIDLSRCNHVFHAIDKTIEQDHCELKVYFLNKSDVECNLSNFRVFLVTSG